MIPLKTQYRARPPDMSNTAPVLNELAAEQSHNTIPATSATIPRRFSGLAVTMVFTTSGPNLRMSSVSIGPGATQFTRISVSQTSRDRAFVNAITPALAAEYAAKLGNPSLPASEPILTIRPCPARRMSGRIWRVTSNTPTRFTWRMWCHSAGVELLEGLISAEISSIVHKNIDARRLLARLPEGSCNFIGLRHIDPERLRAVKFDWIDVPSPDLSAKSYELRRDSPADPSSPAGYDGRLPRKIVLDIHSRVRTRRLLAKNPYFAT